MHPRLCRAPTCDREIAETHFYCPTDYRVLTDGLSKVIAPIYADAADFYVGRTHYPEQRLLYHVAKCEHELPRDHLAVLHWSGDRDEIEWLEKHLIREWKDARSRLKTANESVDSDGPWIGHWHCVYVAWRRKKPDGRERLPWADGTRIVDVRGLDQGRRLAPDRTALLRAPDYVRARLDVTEAREILAHHKRRRRFEE